MWAFSPAKVWFSFNFVRQLIRMAAYQRQTTQCTEETFALWLHNQGIRYLTQQEQAKGSCWDYAARHQHRQLIKWWRRQHGHTFLGLSFPGKTREAITCPSGGVEWHRMRATFQVPCFMSTEWAVCIVTVGLLICLLDSIKRIYPDCWLLSICLKSTSVAKGQELLERSPPNHAAQTELTGGATLSLCSGGQSLKWATFLTQYVSFNIHSFS